MEAFHEGKVNRQRNGQFGEKPHSDPGQLTLDDGILGSVSTIVEGSSMGNRYDGYHKTPEVSREVRQRIKEAQAAGLIDKNAIIGVKTSGNTVLVHIRYRPEYWTVGYCYGDKTLVHTKEARQMENTIQRIFASYNFTRDTGTDYAQSAHYCTVTIDDEYVTALKAYEKDPTPETLKEWERVQGHRSQAWLDAQDVSPEYQEGAQ